MIQVYETVLDEKEIIGVGPIMVKRSTDPVVVTLYHDRQFYFELYLTKYHFVISTDWLRYDEENKEQSVKEEKRIKEVYKVFKECVICNDYSSLMLDGFRMKL